VLEEHSSALKLTDELVWTESVKLVAASESVVDGQWAMEVIERIPKRFQVTHSF
jgi:hypothetical protein